MRTRFWIGSLLIALALAPGVSVADEALVRRLQVRPGSPGSADVTLCLEIARGHVAERGRPEPSPVRRYRLRVSDGRSVTRWTSDWRPIPSGEDVRLQCALPLQETCPRDTIGDSAFDELRIEVMVEQPGLAPSAATFTLYRWVAGGYRLFPEPRPWPEIEPLGLRPIPSAMKQAPARATSPIAFVFVRVPAAKTVPKVSWGQLKATYR